MLRKEINAMLDIFDYYKISEEKQREIIEKGICFDFTYGDPDPSYRNRNMTAFQFAELLKFCKRLNIEVDVTNMVNYPWEDKYENLILMHESSKQKNFKKHSF